MLISMKKTAAWMATIPTVLSTGGMASVALNTDTSLHMSDRAEDFVSEQQKQLVSVTTSATSVPVPRIDEPNLFNFPDGVYPTYRQLPAWSKLAIAVAATALGLLSSSPGSLMNSVRNLGWWLPIKSMLHGIAMEWKKAVRVLGKAVIIYFLTTFSVQEAFFRPTRVSIEKLTSEYFLPSKLSMYQKAKAVSGVLGTHFIEARGQKTGVNSTLPVLYLNHGFGASSLSWLPALIPLVEELGCSHGIGHDAPGFGFTERGSAYVDFSSNASAQLGISLMRQRMSLSPLRPVILMGHSMGAITTLHMALTLRDQPKHIILVAPALGLRAASKKQPVQRKLIDTLIDFPASFILRRVVGTPNFWKRGLSLAWGDPSRLSDSDVLRFQWPSIGKGWERGLLRFSRAQYSEVSDEVLMQQVINLPNTRVDVIVGTRDRVISLDRIKRFLKEFPSVRIVAMEGLGHDPFEEATREFVSNVSRLVKAATF